MTRYTGAQIYDAATRAGFSPKRGDSNSWAPAEIIAAIALAESGGDDQATALTSKEHSVGVYQINLYAHPDITEADARDLARSSAYVYHLSAGGTNFQPWTTFKDGAYLHFLPLGNPSNPTTPPAPASAGGQSRPVSSGGSEAGSILGLTPPSADEWRQAGVVFLVGMAAFFLVAVGLTGVAWGHGGAEIVRGVAAS